MTQSSAALMLSSPSSEPDCPVHALKTKQLTVKHDKVYNTSAEFCQTSKQRMSIGLHLSGQLPAYCASRFPKTSYGKHINFRRALVERILG